MAVQSDAIWPLQCTYMFLKTDDIVLRRLSLKTCLECLDYIPTKSEAGLPATTRVQLEAPRKCNLFRKKVKFLSYVVCVVSVSPQKITAFGEWPVPKEKYDVGSSGYARTVLITRIYKYK